MRLSLALVVGLTAALPVSAQTASRVPTVATTAGQLMAPELAQALDLGQATEQSLELPERLVDDVVAVPLEIAGQVETLELWPHSMRHEAFEVRMQVADGSYVDVEPAPVATVRGRIVGRPQSIVSGQILDGSLTAVVVLDPALPVWGIQPMRDVDPSAPAARHAVYDSRDRLPMDVTCGTDDTLDASTPSSGGSYSGGTQVCEIAFDADTQFYSLNGSSVSQTQQDIENIMNSVETLYTDEVGISYEITTIIVRTSEPDPYSSSNAGSILGELQNHWNSQQQSVQRDVAHLMTGKNISGSTIGIAYLNVICNIGSAYGVSQSRFTNNFNSRVALTAHELGHNWSAQHCNGSAGCQIMCSGLGGCGGIGGFGPSATNQINNKKNNSGCLVSSVPPDAPTIASIQPSSTGSISNAIITLTGTSFEQLVSFQVGPDVYDAGLLFDTSETTAKFVVPTPSALGPQGVSLTNVTGPSNEVDLTFTANEPPIVSVTSFALTGQDLTWEYGADAGDTAYLLVSLDGLTFPFSGDDLLLNFTIVAVDTLDAAGLGELLLSPLPAAASGLTLRSQLVAFSGGAYDDASSIATTTVFF